MPTRASPPAREVVDCDGFERGAFRIMYTRASTLALVEISDTVTRFLTNLRRVIKKRRDGRFVSRYLCPR